MKDDHLNGSKESLVEVYTRQLLNSESDFMRNETTFSSVKWFVYAREKLVAKVNSDE